MRIGRKVQLTSVWPLYVAVSLVTCLSCRSAETPFQLPAFGASPHEATAGQPRNEASAPEPDSVRPNSRGPAVLDLVFDLARVEFRADGERPSLKLWNHLDTMRIDPQSAVSLARNGLRVGVGGPEAWPALRAILERAGGSVQRDQFPVARGAPLLLDLGAVPEGGASVFAYDSAGRLAGRTFDAGRYVMQIDYVYHLGPVRSLDLKISLEIRKDRGVMTWKREGAVIRQVPSIDRHVFDGAHITVSLADEEFLVIGPDAEESGAYLVGNRFLLHDRGGERYETVLFLTPKVVETGAATTPRRVR